MDFFPSSLDMGMFLRRNHLFLIIKKENKRNPFTNYVKTRVNMKAVFWLGIMVLMQMYRLRNRSAHPTYLCFGLFSNLL